MTNTTKRTTTAAKTCKLHHVALYGMALCPLCNHRDRYMVHGNVTLFDEGFNDGYAGKPNTRSRSLANSDQFEDASYSDGWKNGMSLYREQHPLPELPGRPSKEIRLDRRQRFEERW